MPESDSVGANVAELLGAAVELRRGTSWADDDANADTDRPTVGNALAQDAIDRAAFLLRNLSRRYRGGLAAVADAIVQGAVDVSYADDPTGEV